MKTSSVSKVTNRIFEEYINEIKIQENHTDTTCTFEESIQDRGSLAVAEAFQKIDWAFTENDTTYLSHDIHPYPAKFIPQLPETIIKLLSSRGEVVWDPFGGSGTTAVEALLNNRTCISTDINPLGTIIGKAKTTSLRFTEEEELEKFISKIEYYSSSDVFLKEYIDTHRFELEEGIPKIPNIEKWFGSTVICELAFIKHMIKEQLRTDAVSIIAKASLSKIITKVSNQESETTYRAITRNLSVGQTIATYLRDLKDNFAKVRAIGQLLGFRSARFITANVMEPMVGEGKPIGKNDVDLIITSPPYPNAFDYHLYHRFRIFWLDGDPIKMGKSEIGSHLKYQRSDASFEAFENELRPALINCFHALKPGRFAVFVLGNAIFKGVQYNTADRIKVLSEEIGFEFVTIANRPLPENKRSVKTGARRATYEQLLVIKKPAGIVSVDLCPVNYKLWPYEKVISDLELTSLAGSAELQQKIDSRHLEAIKKLTFIKSFWIENTEIKTWQSILEQGAQKEGSGRKEPKYVTHGIHSYKGKFYPQLVRPLLNILNIKEGGTVFDPFCGSGTVALESILNGYKAFGCDINPIAAEIARAKNNILAVPPYEFEKHIALFKQELTEYEVHDYSHAFSYEAIEEIYSWFPLKVVNKMGFILNRINDVPDERIRCFSRVILSSIIRDISQQEPSDLRIRRRKEPLEDAPVIEMFLQHLLQQQEKILAFHRIRNLAPCHVEEASIKCMNATNCEAVKSFLPKDGVDIVITSPPYATALPYIDTNRLNLLVLNGLNAALRIPVEAEMTGTREIRMTTRQHYEELISAESFASITSQTAKALINKLYIENKDADVGFRKKNMAALIYMYFNDMAKVMYTLDHVVKPKGYICIVVGDTKTTTGVETTAIKTTEVLRETGCNLKWTLLHDIPISVTVEKYLHMNNSITENNILIFQRP